MTEKEILRLQKWTRKHAQDCEERDRKWKERELRADQAQARVQKPVREQPQRDNRGLVFLLAAILYFPFGVIMGISKKYK
jgi:hypothetical protein